MKEAVAAATIENDIVIAAGLLVLWDEELCGEADLRVFVDCPADVRVARRIKRNLSWGLSVDDIVDVYVDLVRFRYQEYVEPTKAKADIVVDSLNGLENAAELIQKQIR